MRENSLCSLFICLFIAKKTNVLYFPIICLRWGCGGRERKKIMRFMIISSLTQQGQFYSEEGKGMTFFFVLLGGSLFSDYSLLLIACLSVAAAAAAACFLFLQKRFIPWSDFALGLEIPPPGITIHPATVLPLGEPQARNIMVFFSFRSWQSFFWLKEKQSSLVCLRWTDTTDVYLLW